MVYICRPEYGGMATQTLKFFLIFNGELFQTRLNCFYWYWKWGLLSYIRTESSSCRNSHILWIPENIIIRNVSQYKPGDHGSLVKIDDDKIKYYEQLIKYETTYSEIN